MSLQKGYVRAAYHEHTMAAAGALAAAVADGQQRRTPSGPALARMLRHSLDAPRNARFCMMNVSCTTV